MTDQGAEQSRSRFSWIREIFGLGRNRPPVLVRDRDVQRRTLAVQIDIIRHAFDEKVHVATDRDGAPQFMCHPERVLVLPDDVESVEQYFADRPDVYRGTGSFDRLVDGLMLYELPPRHRDGEVHLLEDLDELDRELRAGVATPDHVLHVSVWGKACPATEPSPPPSAAPIPALAKKPGAGKDIRISLVDTGWFAPAAKDSDTPWLASGVDGDVEHLVGNTIHEYAGHGTFVAGVVKCIAPAATIEVEGFLTKGGAIYESEITQQLNEAMTDSRFDPQVVSISAGTHTRKDFGLLGFQVLATLHKWSDAEGGPLVVAAAGNDSTNAPFWPAAFDWVLSVGSLDADGKRSWFSNYGSWVDVWAQGSNLVNAFPTGTYTYVEPASGKLCGTTQSFTGLAQWSGTSFSTPVVTGAIAAYMSDNGVSAREARDALIAAAPTKHDQKAGTMKALGPPFVP